VASEQYKSDGMKMIPLSGRTNVSAFGDPDASGILKYRANDNQFCYELNVSNIAAPTAVTITSGTMSAGGQVVTSLQTPASGSSQGCSTLEADTIEDMARNPGNYHVNVLNSEFPAGAIRGQLR
jgi:CHRD domain